MFKNKSGNAYDLIYGLFFLLAVGIIFVIFNQITQNELRNVLDQDDLNFTQESKDYADKYIGAWKLVPVIMVFIIGLFFIIWAGAKGDRNGYS